MGQGNPFPHWVDIIQRDCRRLGEAPAYMGDRKVRVPPISSLRVYHREERGATSTPAPLGGLLKDVGKFPAIQKGSAGGDVGVIGEAHGDLGLSGGHGPPQGGDQGGGVIGGEVQPAADKVIVGVGRAVGHGDGAVDGVGAGEVIGGQAEVLIGGALALVPAGEDGVAPGGVNPAGGAVQPS